LLILRLPGACRVLSREDSEKKQRDHDPEFYPVPKNNFFEIKKTLDAKILHPFAVFIQTS
jgi:hypothetical protein